MRWNPSRTKRYVTKSTPTFATGDYRRGVLSYSADWTWQKAMAEAVERVTWVYRCVDAIASNAARMPIIWRENDPYNGEIVERPGLYSLLNSKTNEAENSFIFRYRLSAQLLLSKTGVFVEVLRSRSGDVLELYLLQPDRIKPVPSRDPRKLIEYYEYDVPSDDGRRSSKKLDPEDVIWIRRPHPFDPFGAMTPLQSIGAAVETDWLAKMYNRNFLLNDGRPGGIVVVKGDMIEEDKEELRARFGGGVGRAGRLTVIASEEGADFVDTAVTPRDAQYTQTRESTKDEILIGFGVPESVLGDAAGRTMDNAEIERLIFWQETMIPHLDLVMKAFDVLDGEDNVFASYDLSRIDVLQRMEIKRREFLVREFDAGLSSANEYRQETGRRQIENRLGDVLWVSTTRQPAAMTDGGDFPEFYSGPTSNPGGRPPTADNIPSVDDESRDREDDRLPALDNTPKVMLTTDEYRQKIEAWSTVAFADVDAMTERLRRVLTERINGPKFKRAAFKEGADSDTLFELALKSDVWKAQVAEDLKPVIQKAFTESYIDTCSDLDLVVEPKDIWSYGGFVPGIQMIVDQAVKSCITSWLTGDRDDLKIEDLTRSISETLSSDEYKANVKHQCDSMAVFAINAGVAQACADAGVDKKWVAIGTSPINATLDGTTVGPTEFFKVGAKSVLHPYSSSNMAMLVPQPAHDL